MLIQIQIGIQSLIRAYLSSSLQKLILLYSSTKVNIRLIILLRYPLFYIGSPLGVARQRFYAIVLQSRRSPYTSIVTCVPPYTRQCELRSPSRRISPSASLIATSILGQALMRGPLFYRLQILIIIISSPTSQSQRAAIKGLYCFSFQFIILILQLTIKQIFVIGLVLYRRQNPLRQYINLVNLLYTSSYIIKTQYSSSIILLKKGQVFPQFIFL